MKYPAYLEIELQRGLHVSQLLQRVAQITITLGEIRIHSYALLIIKDAFREVSKLEMHRAEQQKVVCAVRVRLVRQLAAFQRLLVRASIV